MRWQWHNNISNAAHQICGVPAMSTFSPNYVDCLIFVSVELVSAGDETVAVTSIGGWIIEMTISFCLFSPRKKSFRIHNCEIFRLYVHLLFTATNTQRHMEDVSVGSNSFGVCQCRTFGCIGPFSCVWSLLVQLFDDAEAERVRPTHFCGSNVCGGSNSSSSNNNNKHQSNNDTRNTSSSSSTYQNRWYHNLPRIYRYTRSDMYQDVILSLWYRRCREMVRNSVELVDFSDTTLIQRMQFSHHMSWSHSRRKWSFGGLQRIFKRHDENIVLNPPHMRVLSRKTQRTSHMQKSLWNMAFWVVNRILSLPWPMTHQHTATNIFT